MTSVKELAFRAGFTGENFDNTQIGTSYYSAIKNLIDLVREETQVSFAGEEVNVWVVYNNTDLCEGRGSQFAQHTCEKQSTALRLAHKAGVQGSDATVRKATMIRIGGKWYGPRTAMNVVAPSKEDLVKEAEEARKTELARKRDEVLQKARVLGLTAEEIELFNAFGCVYYWDLVYNYFII